MIVGKGLDPWIESFGWIWIKLGVDLKDFNQAKAYAAYVLFKVENESKNYELKLGVYSG